MHIWTNFSCVVETPGTYVVNVTVSDLGGGTAVHSFTLTVVPAPATGFGTLLGWPLWQWAVILGVGLAAIGVVALVARQTRRR